MSESHDVTFNLKVEVSPETITSITEINRLLTTYISLARRTGLPEDVVQAIALLQQIRVTIQTATQAIYTLLTATGPLGWATGLGGLAITGLMLADQMSMRRPRY